MHSLPFNKPGRFYRGNLHTHSTRSDGRLSPEAVIEAYRGHGYDFISLTDHFLPNSHFRSGEEGFVTVSDTSDLRSAEFTTILGAEIHGPGMENGEQWHLVANGLPLDFAPWTPGETGPRIAKRAVVAGAYVTIAHPSWNALSVKDAMDVIGVVHGIEIYNTGCDVGVDRGEGWHFTDVLLGMGHRLAVIATDDAHVIDPPEPVADAFGGWVQVKSESRDPAALLAALKAGWFYSSTAPAIHDVRIADGELSIACSPARRVVVTGLGARSAREHGSPDHPIETSTIPIERFRAGGYCRVTVIDDAGKRAWTNPIWLDNQR